jgi:hypothetical protein
MLIFDFYAGTGSSTQAFADAGHRVIRFENDPQFDAERYDDISTLKAADLVEQYGRPDFVWASPPCTSFSVASIGRHWHAPGIPKTQQASDAQDLVGYTVDLIRDLDPRFGWLMENPRGMLRKLPVVADLERRTITYCAYGDFRMKPTDLWGGWQGGHLDWPARTATRVTCQRLEVPRLGLREWKHPRSKQWCPTNWVPNC